MTKNYNEELADLNNGLIAINKIINSSGNTRLKRERAIKSKDIQEARIDFFKRGYNFYKRELNNQQKLL